MDTYRPRPLNNYHAGDSSTYRPSYGRSSPLRHAPKQPAAFRNNDMYQFGSNARGRGGFSFRSKVSERELLTHRHDGKEDQVVPNSNGNNRFRDINNLTDSEEEPMDEDSDDEDGPSKRRKLNDRDVTTIEKPKWSNPDPYTALPPASESTSKPINFVKLIRKARNEHSAPQTPTAEENDFISFDDFGDMDTDPPSDAPTGPKSDLFATANAGLNPVGPVLGKRKREKDEERLMGSVGRSQFHANGIVLAEWRTKSDISPTPWCKPARDTDSPIVALHKEILDFYAWVKPNDFEGVVREDVIKRLQDQLRFWSPGELKPFGSYAAGLYLPIGDMDLVYNLSGRKNVGKNQMYKLGDLLTRKSMAQPGTVTVIPFAKVPIIKFVDAMTGIKVDLSFNNDTGTTAIDTFEEWKAQYPALSVIVAIIKQFLMIRGLNDNAVGGLGGFATICLVTSVLQHLPAGKHHNLGEVLLEFFNIYGNLLDIRDVGIRLDPPGYIDKHNYRPLSYEKKDRLMIVDPNRPDNNITGGSSEIVRIFSLFSQMFNQLQTRMDKFTARDHGGQNFSFLEELIGGDFTAYYEQRTALHEVYARMYPERGKSRERDRHTLQRLECTSLFACDTNCRQVYLHLHLHLLCKACLYHRMVLQQNQQSPTSE